MKNVALFMVFILTSISCDYYVLEIDLPNDDPKLVINGFFNPDSTVRVYISEGLSILDPEYAKPIYDADVRLYNMVGEEVAIFSKSDSNYYDPYMSNFYPEAGEIYRIEAKYEGLPIAYSEETIPEDSAVVSKINIQRLDLTPDSLTYTTKYSVSFTLEDPPGEDYYEVMVQNRYRGWLGPTNGNVELSSKDPVFNLFPEGYSLIFEDNLFDESSRTITLEVELEDYGCLDEEECYDGDVRLIVRKTSESYYLYNSSYDLYGSLQDNPLAEPVRVYSNVKDGFGIFAGYQTSIFPIQLPKD